MREIRFRAWDHRAGKMWNPIIRPDGVLMAENGMGGYASFYDQEPQDPLMQFTGLKDKNGVDIYDGDILKQGINSGTVIWDENMSCWNIENFYAPSQDYPCVAFSENGHSSSEVIGNIHQNPELLEKE